MFFSERRQWICLCFLCLPFCTSRERSHQLPLPFQRRLFQIPTFTAFCHYPLSFCLSKYSEMIGLLLLRETGASKRKFPQLPFILQKPQRGTVRRQNGWNGVEKGGHKLGSWSSTANTRACWETLGKFWAEKRHIPSHVLSHHTDCPIEIGVAGDQRQKQWIP